MVDTTDILERQDDFLERQEDGSERRDDNGKDHGHLGKTDGDIGLTTLVSVELVTSTIVNDNPMIDREGGVENQSNRDNQDMDLETKIGLTQWNSEGIENSFECRQCYKAFGSDIGLKIHQGKTCKKKTKQCRSSDRQTRSKSSQEANHS